MLTAKEMKIKRIINEVTATSLADKLGISKSYVSLIEKGRREIPESLYSKWIEIIEMKI
jgi:transcriptional regulator with XRE-family HTH domain